MLKEERTSSATRISEFSIQNSEFPLHHAAEGSAAAAAAAPPMTTSLATLLTSHILQDGEIVLLILKPSLWFIILSGLRYFAVVLFLMFSAILFDDRMPGKNILYLNAGLFLITCRLVWAILQWMARVYVLTDRRILVLSGVFSIDIFDCPLRKVARTRIVSLTRERLLRLGTIQIIPASEEMPDGLWQMVAKPMEVHEQIVAAITRTKQGGLL